MNEEHLQRIIKLNYNHLKKKYCGSQSYDITNKQSENIEDMFHNSIFEILSHPEKFKYKSDKETLSYIKRYLFLDKMKQQKNLYNNTNTFIELDALLKPTEEETDEPE